MATKRCFPVRWIFRLFSVLALPAGALAWDLPDTLTAGEVWPAMDSQQVFTRQTLFEYINGGADVYLRAGMVGCLARRYRASGNAETEIEINAYDLERPLHAFGLFRELTEGDSLIRGIGSECAWKQRRVAFHKDRYYLEIIDKSAHQVRSEGIGALAIALAKLVPGGDGMPTELAAFPDSLKMIGSERYATKDYLARGFMQDVLSALYVTESGRCEVFIMGRPTESEARKAFASIKHGFGADEKSNRKSPLKSYNVVGSEKITAVLLGKRIFGATGMCKERHREGLLAMVLGALPASAKQ